MVPSVLCGWLEAVSSVTGRTLRYTAGDSGAFADRGYVCDFPKASLLWVPSLPYRTVCLQGTFPSG